jgi:hypothetical protein
MVQISKSQHLVRAHPRDSGLRRLQLILPLSNFPRMLPPLPENHRRLRTPHLPPSVSDPQPPRTGRCCYLSQDLPHLTIPCNLLPEETTSHQIRIISLLFQARARGVARSTTTPYHRMVEKLYSQRLLYQIMRALKVNQVRPYPLIG